MESLVPVTGIREACTVYSAHTVLTRLCIRLCVSVMSILWGGGGGFNPKAPLVLPPMPHALASNFWCTAPKHNSV